MGIQSKLKKTKNLSSHTQKIKKIEKVEHIEKEISGQKQPEAQNKNKRRKQFRKFRLSENDLNKKIERLTQKIKEIPGLRKNLYHMLTKLRKASEDPDKFLKDPEKLEQDKQKRVEKKLLIKKEQVKQQKQETRYLKHCLFCNKKGHTVEECEEAQEKHITGKICYACGKNDHTLKDCPQKSDKQTNVKLKFAVCYICNEKGHISRDCTQNEKGLYKHGGGCYICGDVKHIRKDCPKNPENSLQVLKYKKRQVNDTKQQDMEPEYD